MGQKVNPINFRIGSIFTSKSRWFADKKDYANKVLEDFKLRGYLNDKLANAGLVQVDIERSISKIKVMVLVARPGVVIGKGGANLEAIKKDVEKMLNAHKLHKDQVRIDLKVEEVKDVNLSSKLVVERIISQMIARYPHRRAINQALEKVMGSGA